MANIARVWLTSGEKLLPLAAQSLKTTGIPTSQMHFFLIRATLATTDTAVEIAPPTTAFWNAVAQPINIKSSSALDTSDGTGVRTVRVILFNKALGYIVEEVILNGTTAVVLANKANCVISFCIESSGTGHVAAGNIILGNTDITTTYLTMTAGDSCSVGTRLYIPTDYKAIVTFGKLGFKTMGNVANGGQLTIKKYSIDCTAYCQFPPYIPADLYHDGYAPAPYQIRGKDGNYLALFLQYITGAETATVDVQILVYKDQ